MNYNEKSPAIVQALNILHNRAREIQGIYILDGKYVPVQKIMLAANEVRKARGISQIGRREAVT